MDPETNDDVQACALLQNISSLKLLEKLPVAHALIDASPISQRISVPGNDKPTDSDALLSLFSPATASKNSRFQRGEADHRDAGSSAAIETANTSPAYSKTSSAVPTPIVPGLDEDRAPAPPTQDLAWSSTETPRSAPLEPYPSSESSGIKLAAVFTPKWANSAWQKLFSHSDFFSALTAPALKDLTSTLNSHSELAPSSPATVATIGGMPFSIFTQSLSTTDKHWVLLTAILSRSPASSPSNSEQSSQQHTDVHLHKRKRSRSPNQCETTLLASAPQTPIPSSTHDLLQTDPLYNILKESTMGRLTLEYPWHETSLGPISHWGPELRTLISQLHQSPFRSALWVGSDLTMLYNDCYIQAAGRKHPHGIFGKKGSVAWAEIWDQVGVKLSEKDIICSNAQTDWTCSLDTF